MLNNRFGIALLATCTFAPQIADAEQVVTDPVIVSTTRFPDREARSPASISVITREDIERIPAVNIPDILGTLPGVTTTSIYGHEGLDASVDVRGFGDTGSNNTLILVDGQRLNTVDMSSIQWSTVPLQAIERIEVIRGAGSVLFGDRASGGVINLITDKSGQPRISAGATLGSYGYRAFDGSASGGGEAGYVNAFLHASDGNGWRQNGQSRQVSLSGRGAINLQTAGEVFLDYTIYRNDYGMPGSVSSSVFRDNPRLARTPYDTQEKDGYRLRPGVSLQLAANLDLNAELAFAGETQHSNNVSFSSLLDRSLKTVSFTPRLRWRHGLGALKSETTIGVDYYHGRVVSDSTTWALQSASQTSRALYLQNTTSLNDHWSITLGGRRQSMNQQAQQAEYPLYFMPAFSGSSSRSRSIYDLGLHYQTSNWSAYAKTGTSFRFANTDELFAYDPLTGNPVYGGDIRPQRARNHEVGGYLHWGAISGQLALYRMDVKDEIGYDGNAGANVNFDPTRHQGIETEVSWKIDDHWHSKIAYTYTDASFRSGPYAGKEIPSVAANKATLQLGYDGAAWGNYTGKINYVGQRHVSGDYDNIRQSLSAYTTVDLRANWKVKALQINASALNLFDKRYAPYGLYSSYMSDYYYFPADGRTLFVSASYDFK